MLYRITVFLHVISIFSSCSRMAHRSSMAFALKAQSVGSAEDPPANMFKRILSADEYNFMAVFLLGSWQLRVIGGCPAGSGLRSSC